jgi:ribose transport system substrate-binding protein
VLSRRKVLTAVLSLACVALAACSSAGSSSSSSPAASSTPSAASSTPSAASSTPSAASSQAAGNALANILAPVINEPTSVGVTTPLSRPAPKGIKVVGLDDGIVDENLYYQGMAAAAKVLGWSFSTQSIDDSNPQTVISAATSAINAGARAVVMVSELQSTINKVLPLANQHHAVILDTISSNSAHPGQILGSTEDHEFYTQGRYVIAAILQQAAAAGQVAHIGETFIPQFATGLIPEENGAKQVLAQYCPKCTMDRINVSYEDVTNGSYVQDIASYLQTHRDINYLFATNAFFVNGLVPALKQAGIPIPKIVGTEPTAANFSALKTGAAQEWFYVPQTVLGWVWTDELARYFSGGDYNIWNTTAFDPQWLMTGQNIQQVPNVNNLNPPADYQAQFEKLWGVSS